MAKRQALGRGLGALLDHSGSARDTESIPRSIERTPERVRKNISVLTISQIEANPLQPRTKFDDTALEELARSIKELGIIQPITVRKLGVNKYQLISGERRFRASQLAGLTELPVYVREANDQQLLEMSLVENIQREDLDPIEVAISYQRLIEECDLTQEELSGRVGKNRSTVTNYIRLLKLPAEIQVGLINGDISMGHARALVSCGSESVQVKIFRDIIKNGLSVRKVEEMVRSTSETKKRSKPSQAGLSFEDQKYQADLKIKYGKNSSLKKGENGKGKIEIQFNSQKEFEQIIRELEL